MRRDKRRTILMGAAYLFALGWLDYATGYEINLTVVYVTPLIMFTVAGGWRAGMIMAFACAATVEGTDILAGKQFEYPIFHIYSFCAHSLSYLSFLFLITQLLHLYDEARDLAGKDHLTGLRNRYGFLAQAEELLGEFVHQKKQAVMTVWNVTRLRQVNAQFGHDKADALLMTIGDDLEEALAGAVLARLEADHFAVLAEAGSAGDVEAHHAAVEELLNTSAADVGVPLDLRRFSAVLPPVRRTSDEVAAEVDKLLEVVK